MILQSYSISSSAAGMRVDAYLRLMLPELPESALRSLFDRRDVKINRERVRRDRVLVAGDELSVYLPDSLQSQPLDIVYEDADVLLINKRAGISVEPDSGGGISLTELCRRHVHGDAAAAAAFPAPCHRLDHQTCGLCLFAKHESALTLLTEAFRQRTLDKRYECLVRGIPKPPEALCTAFLLKHAALSRVEILDHPVPGSRPISTAYRTLSAGAVSRLEVHLITGRTHQIRAHLAALGHPLLGDDVYGDHAFNRLHKARSLKLCATSLTLNTGGGLPQLDGRTFTVSAPF